MAIFTWINNHRTQQVSGEAVWLPGQRAPTVYSLSVDAGSFILTGQSITPRVHGDLLTATGTFILDGQDVGLSKGWHFTVSPGVFIEAGQSVFLTSAVDVLVDPGVFIEDGQNVTVENKIVASTGHFSLSSVPLSLTSHIVVESDTGTFTEDGQDVDLSRGYRILADAGSFSVSGQSVTLSTVADLLVSTGTFTEDGQDVDLSHGRFFGVDAGAFTVTGQDAELRRGSVLTVSPGVFTETGQDATLSSETSLTSSAGTFIEAGQDVELRIGNSIQTEPGSFTATGQDVELTQVLGTRSGSRMLLLVGELLREHPTNPEYRKLAADFGLDAQYTYDKRSSVSLITGEVHAATHAYYNKALLQKRHPQAGITVPNPSLTGTTQSSFVPASAAPKEYSSAYQGTLSISALGASDQVYSYIPLALHQYENNTFGTINSGALQLQTEASYTRYFRVFEHTNVCEVTLPPVVDESFSVYRDLRKEEDDLLYVLGVL